MALGNRQRRCGSPESKHLLLRAAHCTGHGETWHPEPLATQAHASGPADCWEATQKGRKDFLQALGGLCGAVAAVEMGG